MKELLKAIANSSLTERVSLLPQALEYAESGIDFLIECLQDPELEIKMRTKDVEKIIETFKI